MSNNEHEKRTDRLCTLLSGLLASGKYCTKDEEGHLVLNVWDHGKEWNENGFDRRFSNWAILHAEELLSYLEEDQRISEQLEQENNAWQLVGKLEVEKQKKGQQ